MNVLQLFSDFAPNNPDFIQKRYKYYPRWDCGKTWSIALQMEIFAYEYDDYVRNRESGLHLVDAYIYSNEKLAEMPVEDPMYHCKGSARPWQNYTARVYDVVRGRLDMIASKKKPWSWGLRYGEIRSLTKRELESNKIAREAYAVLSKEQALSLDLNQLDNRRFLQLFGYGFSESLFRNSYSLSDMQKRVQEFPRHQRSKIVDRILNLAPDLPFAIEEAKKSPCRKVTLFAIEEDEKE